MRTIHLLAYSCEPGRGSEPGAGWAFLRASLAAADRVTLYTRPHRIQAIRRGLSNDERARLTVVPVPTPAALLPLRRRHRAQMLDYVVYQVRLQRLLRLHVGPDDVVHHVTYASDWFPVLAVRLPVALVLGPVGGYTRPEALALARRRMTLKANVKEQARNVITRGLRALLVRGIAKRTQGTLVVANNDDVASYFCSKLPHTPTTVEPHVAASPVVISGPRVRHDLLFVGRLVAWKGCDLAIETLVHLPESYSLSIAGQGPEQQNLRRMAEALGVAHRVDFLGLIPREDVLERMARAGGFLFPSLHDSAPFAVAEAISTGCPVVCLDLGGPATLVRRAGAGIVVGLEQPEHLVLQLARAVLDLPSLAPGTGDAFASKRLPALLERWYRPPADVD